MLCTANLCHHTDAFGGLEEYAMAGCVSKSPFLMKHKVADISKYHNAANDIFTVGFAMFHERSVFIRAAGHDDPSGIIGIRSLCGSSFDDVRYSRVTRKQVSSDPRHYLSIWNMAIWVKRSVG